GLLYLLCFEHVDNLGAYTASRSETGLLISSVNSNHCPARVLTRLKSPKQKPRWSGRGSAKLHSLYYAASSTDRIFPAGSLNHAMVGPFPREIPRASVFKLGSLYTSNRTPRLLSSSTVFSTLSTGKFSTVKVAG